MQTPRAEVEGARFAVPAIDLDPHAFIVCFFGARRLIRVKRTSRDWRCNASMRSPNVFLAYAPRGVGLRCAVAYFGAGRDAFGWFTGPCLDLSVASRYFVLEDFYSAMPARYEELDEAALHSAWSLEEPRRHELARLRETFAREWLCYRADQWAAADFAAYARAELAAGELGVRFGRLALFSKLQPNWTYYSRGFEYGLLRHLARAWPLEYAEDLEEATL